MAEPRDPRLVVVAIGGHAVRGAGDELERTLRPLVELVSLGHRLVLTHGHGPQLGDAVTRMELARRRLPPVALDVCGAEGQGSVGYAIQQAFDNLCRARRLAASAVTLLTRVVVDPADPAFARPTRPLGPFYTAAQAGQLRRTKGWTLVAAGRRGWRRVLPSPRPVRVLEAGSVGRLLQTGAVPIACGGGGIPVVERPEGYAGVEALVEKDFTSEVLATDLGADRLLFLTDVERAVVNFGTGRELGIERLTLREARALLGAGEFSPGSMGPKIEASIRFVEAGGREAIITAAPRVRAALEGEAGTRVVAD
jgi:carbamate kinase